MTNLDPTDGSLNYNVIFIKWGGNCNKLSEGIEHSYCSYLVNNYSLNIAANEELLGTDEWCERYIRYQYQSGERRKSSIFSNII
ncbi:Hypothetical protein CINCED_3A022184 [Cinara cedri]|uniref:Uncharacterized protein n=1 Tax=Cinara cedri TaxID=506608 RepID=A0A5E4MHT4_9HEMI|nr:Hypothetical protein CINCED_3A022184 [Cinara cedri]